MKSFFIYMEIKDIPPESKALKYTSTAPTLQKETLAQVFSCEFEKKFNRNTFFYRTTPVAASEK